MGRLGLGRLAWIGAQRRRSLVRVGARSSGLVGNISWLIRVLVVMAEESQQAPERLHYEVFPGAGPPLLMVHGLLSSSAQWRNNLPALRELCTPVLVDLWGHGRSAAPTETRAYLPEQYVAQFEQLRVEIDAQRWWLCGYSLGAGLTIRYAMTYPERVLGHVFTNSASAFADDATRKQFQENQSATVSRFADGGQAAVAKIPVHPKFAKRLPPDMFELLCAEADLVDPAAIGKAIAYTNAFASIRERVGENPRPALLAFGEHEKRFAPHADFAEQHMADLEVVRLDAGHAVNIQDRAGFDQAVRAFLTRTGP